MSLPRELLHYAENLYRRFPEEFLALGAPGLEEVYDLRPTGTWMRSIQETPSEKIVDVKLQRWQRSQHPQIAPSPHSYEGIGYRLLPPMWQQLPAPPPPPLAPAAGSLQPWQQFSISPPPPVPRYLESSYYSEPPAHIVSCLTRLETALSVLTPQIEVLHARAMQPGNVQHQIPTSPGASSSRDKTVPNVTSLNVRADEETDPTTNLTTWTQTAQTAEQAAAEKIEIIISDLGSTEVTILMCPNCSLAELTDEVNSAFGLGSDKVAKLVTADAKLLEHPSSSLTDLGITSGTRLTATVQLAEMTIRRHVYRAGGGRAPWRMGSLVSTEEIIVNPTLSLAEQWSLIVGGTSDHHRVICLIADLNNGEAPKLWDDLEKKEELTEDAGGRCSQVFECTKDFALKFNIKGMD